ncbi:MAG: lytic transglycosylase domain-containing protein [Candidatus Mcinerneyibacterium aminivorans]|uniref:Lytic transglycosylase domain-containing protein n=1 Tax=Candidatus Mcinerneyibacterium aminivorans TaxID=2703815 RepID=A0A5D0ML91_9BACT|nr:MAG: lytic transglycosylase domain-containing protein [Candidatus Mcinerneyibacterium aminivorans]
MIMSKQKFIPFLLILYLFTVLLYGEVLIIKQDKKQKQNNISITNKNINYKNENTLQVSNIKNVLREICMKKNINHLLVESIIEVESNFNPTAVSHKGAKGLMQLMPETAAMYDVDNIYNVRENLRAGIEYFRYLFDKFNQNVRLALAAYNAGPYVVKKYGGIPPYRETQNYVKQILEIFSDKGGDLQQLRKDLMVYNNEGNISITNNIYKNEIRRKE